MIPTILYIEVDIMVTTITTGEEIAGGVQVEVVIEGEEIEVMVETKIGITTTITTKTKIITTTTTIIPTITTPIVIKTKLVDSIIKL